MNYKINRGIIRKLSVLFCNVLGKVDELHFSVCPYTNLWAGILMSGKSLTNKSHTRYHVYISMVFTRSAVNPLLITAIYSYLICQHTITHQSGKLGKSLDGHFGSIIAIIILYLTHLPLHIMAAISLTMFSYAFSWIQDFILIEISLAFGPKGPINNNPRGGTFKCISYKFIIQNSSLGTAVNAFEPQWREVNIGSGNTLMPSGNKPLHEHMLTRICVAIWRS